jgi:hypothetical protein
MEELEREKKHGYSLNQTVKPREEYSCSSLETLCVRAEILMKRQLRCDHCLASLRIKNLNKSERGVIGVPEDVWVM